MARQKSKHLYTFQIALKLFYQGFFRLQELTLRNQKIAVTVKAVWGICWGVRNTN